MICTGCGLVIDTDLVDKGSEWRAYDHDQHI
ncbi:MAG: TFIIB-type zinc ribbon-containing protein [Methanohalobium sp.]